MTDPNPAFIWAVSYGITFALMNDKAPIVSTWIRKVSLFDRMLECSFCTGFHAGWVSYLITARPEITLENLQRCSLWGLSSAAVCYAVDTWLRRLEEPPWQE